MKKFSRSIAVAFVLLCILAATVFVCACASEKEPTPTSNNTVTITYDTGKDGSSVDSLTAKPGSKIYPPIDPTRDGYVFDCWMLNGEPYVFDVMPEKSITLTAAWKKLYKITFDTGEGGSSVDTMWLVAGDIIDLGGISPTRPGYKFFGWERNGAEFTLTEMPAEDVALTAVWKAAYTITFNTLKDGVVVPPIVEEAGKSISQPVVNLPGWHVTKWLHNGVEYRFDKMPSENITLTAVWMELTNLPSMFIDLYKSDGSTNPLHDVEKDKDTYVSARVTLTNTEEKFALNFLKAEFKGRGNGSWNDIPDVGNYGKKRGYRIKFDKKQSLFGRTANKHWVVIAGANFDDVTMSRNYLAYNMAGEVFDNIEYSTAAHWIDLYVNNEYRGVYLLCEHVRVGDGRVDIESEYGVEDTGYLIEYDAYAYNEGVEGVNWFKIDGVRYPFTVKSPDPDDYLDEGITKVQFMQQIAYIKNFVQRVYNAALGGNYEEFSKLADVDSFVDMYILHELFKNTDTGYSSFYLYKKPGEDKLYAGPPWDFDATTNYSANDRGDRSPSGIYVADSIKNSPSEFTASYLYISLYKTSGFLNAVKARWKKLSPDISAFIERRMNDEVYATYRAAMGKNFAMWKQKAQSSAETGWIADMKALKKWLTDRVAWLDGAWA
ncbi:MAG: CotH kinase family protein [Clostridiales bacterium]|nr:CotH kinase family protein [Clostridiales bacterium]